MSSALIDTYFEITATSSRCNAGKYSGRLPPRPWRSCARMICSRSLATLAVFFFSPSRKESIDIALTSARTRA
jgi:hypothetical protein